MFRSQTCGPLSCGSRSTLGHGRGPRPTSINADLPEQSGFQASSLFCALDVTGRRAGAMDVGPAWWHRALLSEGPTMA